MWGIPQSAASLATAFFYTMVVSAMGEQDWRDEADKRIESVRKGDFVLNVTGPAGEPITNAEVSVRQTGSRFLFGTCVSGNPASTAAHEVAYFNFIRETFNALVCENAMKWYATEKTRGNLTYEDADRLMEFAATNGMAMRGHCLFWCKPKFVQDWVQALDPQTLRAAVESRLDGVAGRYRGRLAAWDVNNEMLDGSFYSDRLGADIDAWMFRRAAVVDPDVPLFVNEYEILCNDQKLDRYIAMIRRLQAAGAKVGGIGIQEHAAERFAASNEVASAEADRPERTGRRALVPREVWGRLDRLAALGVPIHLTEISSKTPDPQRRADSLEMLFRTAYAHPAVEAVMLWGFWEKRHWLGKDAALVDAQWRVLPAGERIRDLILKEWRTHVSCRSDGSGELKFRGFFGTYEVRATAADGTVLSGRVRTAPGTRRVSVRLDPCSAPR